MTSAIIQQIMIYKDKIKNLLIILGVPIIMQHKVLLYHLNTFYFYASLCNVNTTTY